MKNPETELKWFNKTWLIVILLFVFFPIGIYALWKNESISKGWKIAVPVILVIILIAQIDIPDVPKTKEEIQKEKVEAEQQIQKRKEEIQIQKDSIHKQNIEKLFSAWDGANIELEKKIKESLNDPDSYEHITTTYIDAGTYLAVKTTFTARNVYGGVIKQQVVVQQDTLGNIIKVIKWFD